MAKITLEQARELIESAPDTVVVQVADQIEQVAAARTPRRSGTAAAGWTQELVPGGGVRVVNRVPWIRVLEFGQRFGPLRQDGTVKRLERSKPPHHMLTAAIEVAKRAVPGIVATLGRTSNRRRRAIRAAKLLEQAGK